MTMHDQDDAGDDAIAGIDLQLWRVPPPAAVDRPSLIVRALAPAAAPPKRRRLGWLLAAIVILNAAIATVLVILLMRPPAPQKIETAQPAGGSVDADVRELLVRLEREQRELERKLSEIQELRALVVELSEKVRRYEQQDDRRDRSRVKLPERPIAPADSVVDDSCDEVYCVLMNYEGACCTKFGAPRGNRIDRKAPKDGLPDSLDRASISAGIAAVKPRVKACSSRSTAKGKVKVRVLVRADGHVTSVTVDETPDAALGACVADSVSHAVFARTHEGGSFHYPFLF